MNGRRLTVQEVQDRVGVLHPGTVLIVSTYKNAHAVCLWIHPLYGEWQCSYSNIANGVCHPQQKINKIKKRLQIPYEIVAERVRTFGYEIDPTTYKDTNTKCTFVCPIYGRWSATPKKVFRGRGHPNGQAAKSRATRIKNHGSLTSSYANGIDKAQVTVMQKYGVRHVSQDPAVAKKQASSRSNSLRIKLGKDTHVCTGTYEIIFILWFMNNNCNFVWQYPVDVNTLQKVIVDCVCSIDSGMVFIEIKGRWFPENQKKWEQFPYSQNLIIYQKQEIEYMARELGSTYEKINKMMKRLPRGGDYRAEWLQQLIKGEAPKTKSSDK